MQHKQMQVIGKRMQCFACVVVRWTLRFVQSDFKGQLPALYSRHDNSTSVIPDDMNDMNREEPSRYVSGELP